MSLAYTSSIVISMLHGAPVLVYACTIYSEWSTYRESYKVSIQCVWDGCA